MIRFAALVLLLAACPNKGTTTTTQPQAAGAGCPPAAGVYLASYVQQEPAKGRSGWAVALMAKPATGDAPAYTSMDTQAAGAAGVPPAPTGTLWLTTAGAPPCQAKVVGYYAAKIDGPPASLSYGFELDGCPAPKNPEEAGGIVLESKEAPTGCRFEVPQPIAGRLGEMNAQKQWQRPAKESPLPPPIEAALPQQECTPPACEKLWAFAEVKVDGKPVAWTGAVNWLSVGAPADQCTWPAKRESGFWIPGAQGAALKVTEGQDHPLPLIAVLADGGGAKVALAEANGDYATYDLAPGKATLGRKVSWMIAPPEAWDAIDHLGPICEDEKQH
jgi:hypothetical protein